MSLKDQVFARLALEMRILDRQTLREVYGSAGADGLIPLLQRRGVLNPQQISEISRRRGVIRFQCERCGTGFGDQQIPAGESYRCTRCGNDIRNLFRLRIAWARPGQEAPSPRRPTWLGDRAKLQNGPPTGRPQRPPTNFGAIPPPPPPPPPNGGIRKSSERPAGIPNKDGEAAKAQPRRRKPLGYQSLLGSTLGGFSLEDFLGKGAHGWVFKATHPRAGFPLAVKVIPHAVANSNPVILKRLEREATILRGVSHPNLIRTFGHGRDQDYHFMAMEFVQGMNLTEVMAEWDKPNIDEGLRLFRQVLSGLEAAHKHGVIHRDLKPDNIMVSEKGTVKIMDFGLAREDEYNSEEDGQNLTIQGEILGTPHYMSPEQAEAIEIDHRADIYAAGATFYQVFSGSVPFDDKRVVRIIRAHLSKPPQPPRERNPEIPEDLQKTILRMLAKSRDDRQADCGLILKELEVLGVENGAQAPASPAAEAAPEPEPEQSGVDFPEPALLKLCKFGLTEGWLSEDRILSVLDETNKLARFPILLKKSGYVPQDIERRVSAARLEHRRELNELEARIATDEKLADPAAIQRELEAAGTDELLSQRLVSRSVLDKELGRRLAETAQDYYALIEDMIFGKMSVRKGLLSDEHYLRLIRERNYKKRFEDGLRDLKADESSIEDAKRDSIRYMLKKPLPKLRVPRLLP